MIEDRKYLMRTLDHNPACVTLFVQRWAFSEAAEYIRMLEAALAHAVECWGCAYCTSIRAGLEVNNKKGAAK